MTVEDVKRIEEKMARGEFPEPREWCEGFSVEGGKVSDRKFHGEDSSWNDEDEAIFASLNKNYEYDNRK